MSDHVGITPRWRREVGTDVTPAPKLHKCSVPPLGNGPITAPRPDWTCGLCGRVWRCWNGGGSGSLFWWTEVRGPSREVSP